jgi:predicted DNA-binding transcriptional regulator AlpA
MKRRLRFRDLVDRGLVRNRTTLSNWIKKEGFPQGQLTGPNTRTWGEAEIDQWEADRPTSLKVTPFHEKRRAAGKADADQEAA